MTAVATLAAFTAVGVVWAFAVCALIDRLDQRRPPAVDVASLDCADCGRLMPHEIDGVLAVCLCGAERLVPLPLPAPARDTHPKDTP